MAQRFRVGIAGINKDVTALTDRVFSRLGYPDDHTILATVGKDIALVRAAIVRIFVGREFGLDEEREVIASQKGIMDAIGYSGPSSLYLGSFTVNKREIPEYIADGLQGLLESTKPRPGVAALENASEILAQLIQANNKLVKEAGVSLRA